MIVKYKVSDFAKDLNLSAKKVLDELNAMGSTGKKNSSNLEENELNYLLEKFSKDNSVANLDEFLNSAKAAKEEPKPTEKKAEKKPEAPKAEKKPEQPAAKKAEPAQQNKNNNKHNDKEARAAQKARGKDRFPERAGPRDRCQGMPLLRHRLCPCAARTIRSPWIPALWI